MSTTDLVAQRAATGGRVYAMGAVPAGAAYPYIVIGYAPNAPVTRDMLGTGDPVRRFTVQHFARTMTALEVVAAATFSTFDGQPIGDGIGAQEVASPVYRDPDDDGVLTITHTYRY